MKPLKLTINAFGAYCDKTEIDFEKFGDSGLYLIAGETGSGKTTIFDALSFVLFGQASGSARSDSKALRSDYAKEDNKTYVELEFLNRGEKYHIIRYCGYDKLKKDGTTTSISEQAELILPNKTALTKKTEVDNKITEILGIDKNQFSQIVMIAQGEFQKFLFASTKEKEQIFRKIFNTVFYQSFQFKITNLYNEENKNKSELKAVLENNIKKIKSSDEKLIELIDECNVYKLNEISKALGECIKEDESNLKNIRKESKKLQDDIKLLSQNIKEAQITQKNIQELNELNEKLDDIQKEADDAKKAYEEEKAKDGERKELSIKINKINNDLKEYNILSDKQKEVNEKKADLSDSDAHLKELQGKQQNLKKEHDKNKKECNKFKDLSGEIEKNNSEIKECINKKDDLTDVQNKIKDHKKKSSELKDANDDYKNCHDYYLAQDQNAREIYDKLSAQKAAFLALNLKEGDKCPVCGSVHHPQLAKPFDTEESELDLEQANKDKADALNKENEAYNKATKIKTELDLIEKDLLKYAKKEFKLKSIKNLEDCVNKAMVEIEDKLKKLELKQQELEINRDKKDKLEKSIKDFEDNNKKLDKEIDSEKENISELKSKISSLEAVIKEKQKKLQFKTKQEAQDNLKKYNDELSQLIQALKTKEENSKDKSEILNKEKGRKQTLEKSIADSKPFDLEKLQKELEEKQNKQDCANDVIENINTRYDTNKNLLKSIEEDKKEFKTVSDKLEMLEKLKRTANGELTEGRAKITFENYILGNYFNEIIRAANVRFKEITSHQFELRKAKARSGNAKTGLDLDVFDAYTGKARNVSTLSGGESFKAALALSLGLSDIVQRRAGGIQIDTMFIDEGFGSLDPESIEQTMKILGELSGNKTLIGIISHVETLRNKIENKIIVTKTLKGSKLEIDMI